MMKTRSRRNDDQENQPTFGTEKSKERPLQIKSIKSPAKGRCLKNRSVLKEKTNLNTHESLKCKTRGKGKSPIPKRNISFEENVAEGRVLRSAPAALKRKNLDNNSETNLSISHADSNSSSTLKKCVYMSTIVEEDETCDKDAVYEFVVDINEPVSRRRKPRKKRQPRKPKVFPRKRVHSNSESSIATSSLTTSLAASSCTASVDGNLSFKEPEIPAVVNKCQPLLLPSSVPSIIKPPVVMSNHQYNLSSSPIPKLGVLASPQVSSCRTKSRYSANNSSMDNVLSAIPSFVAVSPMGENSVKEHGKNISVKSGERNSVVMEPPGTPTKSSFCNSSIWTEAPSIRLTMTKHHSTPCKERSGSDNSSYLQNGEPDDSKENCFGFSSDEEEENIPDLPSPLHLSPSSHAHRHGLLSPNNAPSRFAPEVVRRALALKMVSKPLNFSSKEDKVIKVTNKDKEVKAVGRRAKRVNAKKDIKEVSAPTIQQMFGNLEKSSSQIEVPEPALKVTSDVKTSPATCCLFQDIEDKDDKEIIIKHPPRRSYEPTLLTKKKKVVVGGGLCLESEDEDNEVINVEEKNTAETVVQKTQRRGRNKEKKAEKQIDDWASLMNMKFHEVDDFDLCIDKSINLLDNH